MVLAAHRKGSTFTLQPYPHVAFGHFTGGRRATAGHRKYSGVLEKFYDFRRSAFSVNIYRQHLPIVKYVTIAPYNSKSSLLA